MDNRQSASRATGPGAMSDYERQQADNALSGGDVWNMYKNGRETRWVPNAEQFKAMEAYMKETRRIMDANEEKIKNKKGEKLSEIPPLAPLRYETREHPLETAFRRIYGGVQNSARDAGEAVGRGVIDGTNYVGNQVSELGRELGSFGKQFELEYARAKEQRNKFFSSIPESIISSLRERDLRRTQELERENAMRRMDEDRIRAQEWRQRSDEGYRRNADNFDMHRLMLDRSQWYQDGYLGGKPGFERGGPNNFEADVWGRPYTR